MWPWSQIRLLKRALALYAGEHVLEHVQKHGEEAFYLHARPTEITSLFIDLASFTKTETEMAAAEFQELMWGWFARIADGIAKHGGVLDFLIGDAMASWWSGTNHAVAASTCAKDLVAAIEDLNGSSSHKGWPELKIAIGIASGAAHLGSYGTSRRLRYAPMGDTVNLASRLCSLAARQYPNEILISSETAKALNGALSPHALGQVSVAGYQAPMQVYAL
jgi:adenylate cyclase